MASSSDVVKKVMRFKLQLADTAESATVVKILQKLKNLDITVDILSETGIGKTVNSLRRHEQAGEIAKSLVRGWKGLVPKESTSHTEDGKGSERVSAKDKLEDINCPNNGSMTLVDLNHNCLSQGKSRDSSDEASSLKPWKRKADSVKQCEEQKRHKDQNMKGEKRQQESQNVKQNDLLQKKTEIHEDEMDNSVISKKKNNDQSNREYGENSTLQKSRSDSREKFKSSSDNGRFEPDKESQKKSKRSKESSKEVKESLPFESSDKNCTMLKLSSVKEDRSPGSSRSPEAHNKKGKKTGKEKHTALNYEQESENKGHSRNKKAKTKHYDGDEAPKEPIISFESCLDYDCNVLKRKEKSGVKKPPKKIKTVVKEETWSTSSPGLKALKSPVMSLSVASSKQKFKESIMDLMSIPLPAILPECENPSTVEYFERNVEKESACCEVSEEYAGFTGQRLYKKMQVYSGAKTVFLPTMMSLHQQCIRTLQNNINLLYETGGVPFEILEPVLERCTPEQLLRIEEFNPMYIGVTDHLWGKHCQRDFKHSKLQEYESWKEMYTRLSEERERKLYRLTKTIVSANSIKPKGRQVKMAFIHTVAKPPRDVRIQQEIHGTAVQQPHQPRCSVKVQENRVRPSCNEPSRSSSTSSGAANTQDLRKKTRVAPMMAKSLKAFKKQLGRR